MSASNSLAAPLRRLSTRLLGASVKDGSSGVSQKGENGVFMVVTPFDTERTPHGAETRYSGV